MNNLYAKYSSHFSVLIPQLLVNFLGVVVTVCAANPWVLIPAVVIMTSFFLLRTYYLKTSREIKRLESVGEFNTQVLRILIFWF